MNGFKTLFLTAACVTIALTASGCESVDTAMKDIKNSFASLEWQMPKITPTNKGYGNDDEGQYSTGAGNAPQENEPETIKTASANQDFVVVNLNRNCPQVTILDELDSLHQFSNPARPVPENKISSITLTELKTNCTYNENTVAVELDLTFKGEIGPAARIWQTDRPSFAYPYFMAITTPNGNIVAKEVFAATVSYDKGQNDLVHRESLRQIIPLNGEFDTHHSIMLGFQLTEEELAYNRMRKNLPPYMLGASPSSIETGAETATQAAAPMTITPERKPETVISQAAEERQLIAEATEDKTPPAAMEPEENPAPQQAEPEAEATIEAEAETESETEADPATAAATEQPTPTTAEQAATVEPAARKEPSAETPAEPAATSAEEETAVIEEGQTTDEQPAQIIDITAE